jgi:preprotein translocase subunit SecG
MEYLLIGLHVVVCFILIMVVLLQSGKAADLAGAFGGGGSQTALGSRGAATVLTKATTISAVLFMITSLSLAIIGSRRSGSVFEQAPVPASAPAAPPAGAGSAPAGPAGESQKSAAPAEPVKSAEPAKSPAPK